MTAVDPKLLEILVYPLTKTRLTYDRDHQELISEAAGLAYPIYQGIPVMLIDEARIVDEDKAAKYQHLFSSTKTDDHWLLQHQSLA